MGWHSKIRVEHQVELVRTEHRLSVEVLNTKPYSLSQGKWLVLPLHFSSSVKLEASGTFNAGYQLLCYETTSGEDKPLSLFQFSHKTFEDNGRTIIFPNSQRPLPLTRPTDSLLFDLVSLGGEPVKIASGGQVLLALSLLQVKE